MYIDFKCPGYAINPMSNKKIAQLWPVTKTSKYQYSILIDDAEVDTAKRIIKRCHYKILHIYPNEMSRSSNYRNLFFKTHKRPIEGYRCLYCNKLLKDYELQVDHIFPVHKAKTKAGQQYLRKHGMSGVNDPKNLAPACKRCNQNKGAKSGIWLIRAKLGNYKWYWVAQKIVIGILCVVALWFIIMVIYNA